MFSAQANLIYGKCSASSRSPSLAEIITKWKNVCEALADNSNDKRRVASRASGTSRQSLFSFVLATLTAPSASQAICAMEQIFFGFVCRLTTHTAVEDDGFRQGLELKYLIGFEKSRINNKLFPIEFL